MARVVMARVVMAKDAPAASTSLDLLTIPAWRDLPWLVHGFSTRAAGKTTIYRRTGGDLNLGFTAQDDPELVRANRELLIAQLPGSPALVTLRQTHSTLIHRVDASHAPSPGDRATLEGDGMMTNQPGILLGIQTADCVPVLIVDKVRRAVAAFHAGWRGTVAAIVEQGVHRMSEEFGSEPEDLLAAIGPAIGPCCYQVGDEVRQLFTSRFDYADALFSPGSTPTAVHLNLAEANRRQLLHTGVRAEAVAMSSTCTSCNTDRFFSHRAEQGVTGRMLAVIGLRE